MEARARPVLEELGDPAVVSDRVKLEQASRRHKELDELISTAERLERAESDLDDGPRDALRRRVRTSATSCAPRSSSAESEVLRLESELRGLLVPSDPNDGRNVIMEIRGAEGGEEANLFARDLFDMYSRYAERGRWPLRVLSESASDHGGLDEVVFVVQGSRRLATTEERGGTAPGPAGSGHRVTGPGAHVVRHGHGAARSRRGRGEDRPADLRVDVYRSTGPGGQSVNTTDSAVRVTHVPTGIVVAMQDEKSQLQNRAKAMQVLRARLLKAEQDRQAAEQSAKRRTQVGGGGRSEKVRTYNFKENRVTDHRIKLTLHKLDRVLDGELDELVDALLADERDRQLGGGPVAEDG